MRASAFSFRHVLMSFAAAGLLACGLVPSAFAEGEASTPMLASSLLGGSAVIVSEEVALTPVDADGNAEVDAIIEPVIGSFTVDGLTFAVNTDDGITLVAVSSDVILSAAAESGEVEGSLSMPPSITYAGVAYDVTAIGPYAFYLSGATQVALPASIVSVDDRAFRSSDVERVEVDAENPNIASFDGCLYDSQLLSLLLIPEGRAGAVLLPCETEVAEPSKFSHCSLVDAIDVEEGGAAFASWEGLLYDASGQTLLRVPAGAINITIREGCTTIAAGAMEGCAKLERINAPSTATSISPNVFESVPTVSLPSNVILSVGSEAAGVEGSPAQLNAMVALSTSDDDALWAEAGDIEVMLPDSADASQWENRGFAVSEREGALASIQERSVYAAYSRWVVVNDYEGGYLTRTKLYNTGAYMSETNSLALGTSGNPTSFKFSSSGIGTDAAYGSYLQYPKASYEATKLPSESGGYTDGYNAGQARARAGYRFMGWSTSSTATTGTATINNSSYSGSYTYYAIFIGNPYSINFDAMGGALPEGASSSLAVRYGNAVSLPTPTRVGYTFLGWDTAEDGTGTRYPSGESCTPNLTTTYNGSATLYAQWKVDFCDISFATSSEPSDEAYPGPEKPDERVFGIQIVAGEQVAIEDPTRPGYAFRGWVIRNEDGTEAIDQDLVYQGDDGTWYVDAAKLPDYAVDGKVTLTARWTAQMSVDVPSAATFYYDMVSPDQVAEPREAALSGQAFFQSHSSVPLRICGLEAAKAAGAAELFEGNADADDALMSLYPVADALTDEELAKGAAAAAPSNAVSFALDDIVLEAAFGGAGATDYAIPAGGRLALGYRLNLSDGVRLDYAKLSALADGEDALLTTLVYTFAMA